MRTFYFYRMIHQSAPNAGPGPWMECSLEDFNDYRMCPESVEVGTLYSGAATTCRDGITLGIGDGAGSLFVRGDYASIKHCQALLDELAELRQLTRQAKRYLDPRHFGDFLAELDKVQL